MTWWTMASAQYARISESRPTVFEEKATLLRELCTPSTPSAYQRIFEDPLKSLKTCFEDMDAGQGHVRPRRLWYFRFDACIQMHTCAAKEAIRSDHLLDGVMGIVFTGR